MCVVILLVVQSEEMGGGHSFFDSFNITSSLFLWESLASVLHSLLPTTLRLVGVLGMGMGMGIGRVET